jgi:hypothetical protein
MIASRDDHWHRQTKEDAMTRNRTGIDEPDENDEPLDDEDENDDFCLCYECGEPHDADSTIDHCVECGNCLDHCTCESPAWAADETHGFEEM